MTNAHVTFETPRGAFRVELLADQAPDAAAQFRSRVADGTFDGMRFLRVIPGFLLEIAHPGDDDADGEPAEDEHPIDPEATRERPDDPAPASDLRPDEAGVDTPLVSMTDAGPGAPGPHLYIALGAGPWLDERHAVVGRVVEGLDVLRRIATSETDADDRPADALAVQRATLDASR